MSAQAAQSFTAGQIAALLGAPLVGAPDAPVRTVATLNPGAPGALTFIRSPKYAALWQRSACSVAIVTRGIDVPGHDPASRALIVVDDADLAVIAILQRIAPPTHAPSPGVHPTAIVDASASVDPTAAIGPYTVLGPGAAVGPGSVLMARVTLGAGARVGARTTLHPGVVIADRCTVGDHCLFFANVVIGADGFGFRPTDQGHLKIPHAGNAVIEDHVEIGAGSCVDRAKFGSTRVGRGTKIDNLCQIGHGVTIGTDCIICAQCGVAGSVTIGNRVTLAGQAGVADNFTIGDDAVIGAKSGVISNVPAGETWLGYPARKHSITLQIWGAHTRLHKFMRGQMSRNRRTDDDTLRSQSDAQADARPQA